MEELSFEEYSKYFFIASFIIVLILSFFLIRPYLSAIFGGFILTYIFYPLYLRINGVLKKRNLSSFLMVILVVVTIITPLFFATRAVIHEAFYVYDYLKATNVSDKIPATVLSLLPKDAQNIDEYIDGALESGVSYITNKIPNWFLYIPNLIVNFLIMIFIMFYLFRDGDILVKRAKEVLPLKEEKKKILFKRLSKASYAIIYGHIVTALIQGVIGTIGFYIIGVPSPLLWGLIMTILALIPFVGTPVVWIPVGLMQILLGNFATGVAVLLYGALIISSVDNFIKPKIIGERARVHPALVLLGVIGGLKMFGFIGFIIGPLILTTLIIFLDLHVVERSEVQS